MTIHNKSFEYVQTECAGLSCSARHREAMDGAFSLRPFVAAGAVMLAAFASGSLIPAAAQGVYLAPSSASSSPASYTYHNTFPKNMGTFPTTKEIGGGVFAPGLKAGDAFPTSFTLYDEENKPHTMDSFLERKKPLVMVLTVTASPTVMRNIVKFQKTVQESKDHPDIVVVNVSQPSGALQKGSIEDNVGRTLRVVAQEYGMTLPFYWVKNDIYSPDGFTNLLRARSLPVYYVIDANGKIRKIFDSGHEWSTADFNMAS